MDTKTKINSCSACGTSPVSHGFMYATSLIDLFFENTIGRAFGWIKIPREGWLANYVVMGFVGLFRIFFLARFSNNIEKAMSGRSKLIWEEANRRGIKMQQIVMFGKYLEQYRAKINGRSVYFQSIPIPHNLPQSGYDWIDDKYKLAERLRKNGIPAPKAFVAWSFFGAQKKFDKLKKPIIVKPRTGSRGRHTTTNIKTLPELKVAWYLGTKIEPSLVLEEHLFGSVYRATVINNELVGFFRADPPQVTGDGNSSIKKLIEEKNKNHNERIGEIKINDDLVSFISRLGYTLESILESEKTIDLSAKTGRLYGGHTKEMLPLVHPKMHELFEKAGKIVEAPIVGFDLIISDPTKNPDEQVWGVIEANSLPFIDLHYFALEGTPINLAKNVWDLWDK